MNRKLYFGAYTALGLLLSCAAALSAFGSAGAAPLAQGSLDFQDVPPTNPFFNYVRNIYYAGIVNGYPCGGAGEPCDDQNRPYFRPGNGVTRGQSAKIVSVAFFPECSTP